MKYPPRATALSHFKDALIERAALGKAGIVSKPISGVKKRVIGLLGDLYTAEKFIAQASGQTRVHERVLEMIKEVLADPDALKSKTTIV